MSRKKSFITVTDQFCGAGGSSLGATAAGAELKLALNHWQLAIETHNTNFPQALHDCTDISACDPRRYPSTGLAVYLMQRAHMPFAAARHYSMMFLFRIPFYLGLLAAVWALIYQLYQR